VYGLNFIPENCQHQIGISGLKLFSHIRFPAISCCSIEEIDTFAWKRSSWSNYTFVGEVIFSHINCNRSSDRSILGLTERNHKIKI
jgi:hypothetical protein